MKMLAYIFRSSITYIRKQEKNAINYFKFSYAKVICIFCLLFHQNNFFWLAAYF